MTTLQIIIPELACSSCVKIITKVVKTIDVEATLQADTETKLINVETKAPTAVTKTALVASHFIT